MIEASILAVFGPLLPLIVALFKKLWPTVNPRIFSVGLCVLIALVSGATLLIVGQERFELALTSAAATATLVYGIGTGLYKLTK